MKSLARSGLLAAFYLYHALHGEDLKWTLLDGSGEALATGDIKLAMATLSGSVDWNDTLTTQLSLGISRTQMDYRPNGPIDPLGASRRFSGDLEEAVLSLETLDGPDRITVTGSLYRGFRTYNSMWIDEYYRQQYDFDGFPGMRYENPDPKGAGLTLSWQREVISSTGYLKFTAAWLRDRVAPGYEIEDLGTSFGLVRGNTRLETWSGAAEFEGVLNARMRTHHSLRLTSTTAREPRVSWRGSLNWLIGQSLISRTTAALSREDPAFEAWSLEQALEWSPGDHWAVSLTARYYEDTGQIEQANLVSSAAPALASSQVYLTVRRTGVDPESGFSISVGPYFTRYAATGPGTERFLHLYADRDWWWGRLAYRHSF